MIKVTIELDDRVAKHFDRYMVTAEECIAGVVTNWYNNNQKENKICQKKE